MGKILTREAVYWYLHSGRREMTVERKEYLEQLLVWKDEKVIKVVTGLRRSGKSTLLEQYQGS